MLGCSVGCRAAGRWLAACLLLSCASLGAQTPPPPDMFPSDGPSRFIENPFRQPPRSLEGPSATPASSTAPAILPPANDGRLPVTSPVTGPPLTADMAGTAEAPPRTALTKEHITRQLEQVTQATDLDEATRTDLAKRLQRAGESLVAADEATARASQYAVEIRQAPRLISEARSLLAQPVPEPTLEPPAGMPLVQAEQQLSQLESRWNDAGAELAKREAELKRRPERHSELTKLIGEKSQQLDELQKQRAGPPPSGEKPLVTQVRQMEQDARQLALQRQLEQLKLEVQRIDAFAEVAPLQRDLAKRAALQGEKELAAWQRIVADVRKAESRRQADEARRQVENAHPALRQLAERNASLAESRKSVVASIEQAAARSKQMNKQLAQLKGDFAKLQEKVEAAGLSKTIGILLRKQRADLKSSAEARDWIRFIERVLPAAQLELIELEDERSLLGDVDQSSQEVVASLIGTVAEHDREMVEHTALSLLTTKRELLDNSIYDYNTYLKELGEMEVSCRRLTAETTAFANFIDKHVLWIRSAEPLGPSDLRRAGQHLLAWSNFRLWATLTETAFRGLLRLPVQGAVALLIVLTMVVMRHRMSSRLHKLCQTDSANNTLNFLPTLEAIALVLLSASVWPCLVWCAGWWIESSDTTTGMNQAVSYGLQRGAVFLWLFQLVRITIRPAGVGESHFGWQASSTRVVRDSLVWLGVLGIPISIAVGIADRLEEGQVNDSLGRIAFIVGMVATATVMHNLFRRQRGMFHEALACQPTGWLNRTRLAAYIAGTGIPCALSVLAAAGYYYSARQLAIRFELTTLIVFSLVGVHGVATRWFLVKRRNISIRQARERRQSLSQNQAEHGVEVKLPPPNIPSQDLSKIQSQLQYLLRYGATLAVLVVTWFVWSDVLPALRILDRVVVWTSHVSVLENVVGADGGTHGDLVEREVPTTLTHVLLAIVLAAGTCVLGKNLPGLLEITILDRLPIEHGGRNALAIILRYLLYVAGLMLVCKTLSVRWSSVQWLAAAMTVGLGFGLQEIFANLVSGLIILFERPIRVGDLVTVNGVTGTVSRMQIRATTITDFDRREMIVPNKKFITEDVINWTLSDSISRVTVDVGIAYGSDTALAHAILLRVAKEHPLVMAEPAPLAIFKRFGDSTLDFSLHVHIPSRSVYAAVVHDLHSGIDREFRAAAIDIAFPQRDVNIRSIDRSILPMLSAATAPRAA